MVQYGSDYLFRRMTCSPNKFFGRREERGKKKKEGQSPSRYALPL
jgi:hypothetical protein